MDYQKTIKLSDNTQNQPTNFIITNKVEINDETCKTYNTNIEIRFDTSMLTLFRMWWAGGQKGPPTSFSPVICTNVIFGPQNILLFSFNPFATLVQKFNFLHSSSPNYST